MWRGRHAHIDDSQNGCFCLPNMEHCCTDELHKDQWKIFYSQIAREVFAMLPNINFNTRISICRFVFFTLCSSVALSMCLMNPVYEVVGMK